MAGTRHADARPMKLSTCGRFVVLETFHIDREVLGRLASWAEGKGMSPQDAVQLAVVAFVEALPVRGVWAPSHHEKTPRDLPPRSSAMPLDPQAAGTLPEAWAQTYACPKGAPSLGCEDVPPATSPSP